MIARRASAAARAAMAGNTPAARARLVALMQENHGRATFGATGLDELGEGIDPSTLTRTEALRWISGKGRRG